MQIRGHSRIVPKTKYFPDILGVFLFYTVMANGFNYKFKEEVEAESLDWNPSDRRAIVWNAVCNKQIPLGDYIAIFKKKGEIKTAYIFELTDENHTKGFQFCILKDGKTKEIHTYPADNNSRFGRIGERGQMY